MTKETISEKQAHAMAQVCLDLHDALGCKWGDNPYLAIDRLKTAAQSAPVQPVGDDEIAAWAERHDIQGSLTDLRSMFEDAASLTTPPAAQRHWVPVTKELLSAQHPWLYESMWIAMKDGSVMTGHYAWMQGRYPDRFLVGDCASLWAFEATHVMPMNQPKHPAKLKEKNT